jgi:hypothetical protein
MARKGYDIERITRIFSRMIESDTFPTNTQLTELKKELNSFFTEATCLEVLYTRNTDNLFFGMSVMPVISNEDTLDIILNNNSIKIKQYYLELDSKLFSIGLTDREMVAILLHEIGHLVLDDLPVKKVRAAIDDYFTKKDKTISLKNSAQYTQLLAYAIKDTMIKATSLKYAKDEEIRADAFATACGYGDDLISADTKILSNTYGLSKSVKAPKLIILDWAFHLYTNVKFNRIPAINTLKKAKGATASVLTKKELDKVINSLNRIDTDVVQEAAYLSEAVKKRGLAWQIKQNGLKGIQNDYFEMKIRSKNLQDEADMLYLMRQINSRMSLLQDAIEEGDMTEMEKEKWVNLLMQYGELRAEVSNKKAPTHKYGLWYSYDDLDELDKQKSMY